MKAATDYPEPKRGNDLLASPFELPSVTYQVIIRASTAAELGRRAFFGIRGGNWVIRPTCEEKGRLRAPPCFACAKLRHIGHGRERPES